MSKRPLEQRLRTRHVQPERGKRARWLALATALSVVTVAATLFAILPGGDRDPRIVASALATAASGDYVIAIAGGETEDALLAYAAEDPASVREIARIRHLPGYTSRGTTTATGRRAALVVAEAGTPSRPASSLLLIDLDTGAVARVAQQVDTLQTPLFDPSGGRVFFTRTAGGDSPASDVQIVEYEIAAQKERTVLTVPRVLGAYPVGFDASGSLLTVVIDGAGSSLLREGHPPLLLSASITRDWRVSPDGRQVAFIETTTATGVSYHARVIDLQSAGARIAAQEVSSGQQLGVSWPPGSSVPTVGQEPDSAPGSALRAAGVEPGFDVPLGYSMNGDYLVVEAWTGTSFASPGRVEMQVVHGDGREDLRGATRFLGWVTR